MFAFFRDFQKRLSSRSLSFWFFVGVVMVVTGIAYTPVVNNFFVADDFDFLREIVVLDSGREVWRFLWTPLGGNVVRPMLHASLTLDYFVAGLSPSFFHIVNILLHAVNAAGVMIVAGLLFSHRRTAVFAGLIFALWPSHLESVAWIAGRTDVLATTFFLAAMIGTVLAFRALTPREKFLSYLGTGIAVAFAFLTKEVTFSLVLILPLLSVWEMVQRRGRQKKTLLVLMAELVVLTAGVFWIRWQILGDPVGGYKIGSVAVNQQMTWEDIQNGLQAVMIFFWAVVNEDYFKARFPEFGEIFVHVLRGVVIAGVIIPLIGGLLQKNRRSFFWAVGLLIVFFELSALPNIHFLGGITPSLSSSRFLYVPSIFGAILIARAWQEIPKHVSWIGLIVWVGVLAAALEWNMRAWEHASDQAESFSQQVVSRVGSDLESPVIIDGREDNVFGAYVFSRGLEDMVYTFFPQAHMRVFSTGKNAPLDSCAVWADPNLRIFQWEPGSKKLSTRAWQLVAVDDVLTPVRTWNAESLFEWKTNIHVKRSATMGVFEVVGSDPSIVSPKLDISPQQISHVRIHWQFPLLQEASILNELFWSSQSPPRFTLFDRQYKYWVNLDGQEHESLIEVCRSPSWMLQESIAHIRLDFPSDVFRAPRPEVRITEITLLE